MEKLSNMARILASTGHLQVQSSYMYCGMVKREAFRIGGEWYLQEVILGMTPERCASTRHAADWVIGII